jgi:hypothetical protein
VAETIDFWLDDFHFSLSLVSQTSFPLVHWSIGPLVLVVSLSLCDSCRLVVCAMCLVSYYADLLLLVAET